MSTSTTCCYCCTNCAKKTNIARGAFGVIVGILAIITVALLGVSMDQANFPGSNIRFAKYQSEDSTLEHYDVDREGDVVAILDGYVVANTPGCSNIVGGQDGLAVGAKDVCKSNSDTVGDNQIEAWNYGWLVAPDCERSDTDPAECAVFSAQGALGWLGKLTAFFLSVQTILFCVHTCVAIIEQERELANSEEAAADSFAGVLLKANRAVKLTLGLSVTWCIVGFSLFIASYFAWESFCDKIDTGLGRQVNHHHACGVMGCTQSFGSIFAIIIVALVWYRIPNILTWFGVLEAV
tara:strand:- start:1449 stop:2330 length:882 start_codon:yes stop_codon:yes gene_type:complete